MDDLTPLLTDRVEHWLPPRRDIHGREISTGSTPHAARVVMTPGSAIGPASRARIADAAATVWLVDHPRPIAIGDTFGLADGQTLKVVRAETRTRPWGGTVHKVFLS